MFHSNAFKTHFVGTGGGGSSSSQSKIVEWSSILPRPATGDASKLYLNTDTGLFSKWDTGTLAYTTNSEDLTVFRVTFGEDVLANTIIDLQALPAGSTVDGVVVPLLSHGAAAMELTLNELTLHELHTVLSPTTLQVSHDVYFDDVLKVVIHS